MPETSFRTRSKAFWRGGASSVSVIGTDSTGTPCCTPPPRKVRDIASTIREGRGVWVMPRLSFAASGQTTNLRHPAPLPCLRRSAGEAPRHAHHAEPWTGGILGIGAILLLGRGDRAAGLPLRRRRVLSTRHHRHAAGRRRRHPHRRGTTGSGYTSVPATSGQHWNTATSPGPWGVYSTAQRQERLLHNMEHGGIIIWYQPSLVSTRDRCDADPVRPAADHDGALQGDPRPPGPAPTSVTRSR
jgi:hypothetical protein